MAARSAQLEIELDRRRQALRAGLSRYGRRLESDAGHVKATYSAAIEPVAEHPGVAMGVGAAAGFATGWLSGGDLPAVAAPLTASVAAAEHVVAALAKTLVLTGAKAYLGGAMHEAAAAGDGP